MIDFQTVKDRLPIVNVAVGLQLNCTTEPNGQLRSRCPACDSKDNRAIVITPDKNLFYCFNKKVGGDQIALYAHVRNVGMKTAGEELSKAIGGVEPVKTEVKEYDLEEYGRKLDTDHPALCAILPPDLAKAIGAGWCSKGVLKDSVAIPVRLPSGKISGYIGITEAKTPKTWRTE